MKNQKSLALGVLTAVAFACLLTAARGQTSNDGKLAEVTGGGSSVRWDVTVPNAGASLIISAPDGRVFTREYRSGASLEITLGDKQFEKLPDGAYTYELRLKPALSAAAKEALKAARGQDDDPEAERAGRKRPSVPALVQSGSFSILNGMIVVGGGVEGQRRNAKASEQPRTSRVVSGNTEFRLRNHRFSLGALPDQVIPDDLIVQGSACIGLDCVNNESFGFDTIRLKENNTRISFNDTSTAAGFPTNDWTIRANSSASGGASFLAFVDRGTSESGDETGTIVFEVDAGAPANAVKVSSTGKVGFRTATPVLDLHITTSDTPAHRLEQTSAGGFTAQTWDIAGNEANFFVRDVTGGSRLPFRIRPGAPTSSIDISAAGNVGVGTASPGGKLQVLSNSPDRNTNTQLILSDSANNLKQLRMGWNNTSDFSYIQSTIFGSTANNLILNEAGGNVGIGTTAPTDTLSVNGTASKPGGGTWAVFSDERLKNIKGNYNSGLKAVMQLQPLRYEYRRNNPLGLKSDGEHIGFGAQSLQKIIPEAVTMNSNGYLMVNSDPVLWTMLNAIKEQQNEIVQLRRQVQQLRAARKVRPRARR